MVRMSVDQSEKNAFFAKNVMREICLTEEPVGSYLGDDNDTSVAESASKDSNDFPSQPKDTANLLSLLGAVLSDPNTDVSERGACLEILSSIAMHNPSFIRKQCLAEFSASENRGNVDQQSIALARPQPNENRQVRCTQYSTVLQGPLYFFAGEHIIFICASFFLFLGHFSLPP